MLLVTVLFSKELPYNINHRYVNPRKRIQNSYNLLILFLAAESGWSPAADFTLVLNVHKIRNVIFNV